MEVFCKLKISYIGLFASLGCILLCGLFLFWNPYSGASASNDTTYVIFISLILPACIGLVSSFLRRRILMYIALLWSLPYGSLFIPCKNTKCFQSLSGSSHSIPCFSHSNEKSSEKLMDHCSTNGREKVEQYNFGG